MHKYTHKNIYYYRTIKGDDFMEFIEVLEFFFNTLGPYGISFALCYFIMKRQEENNNKLLDFMLKEIEKQGSLMEELKDAITDTKNYMVLIKEEIDTIKGGKEL